MSKTKTYPPLTITRTHSGSASSSSCASALSARGVTSENALTNTYEQHLLAFFRCYRLGRFDGGATASRLAASADAICIVVRWLALRWLFVLLHCVALSNETRQMRKFDEQMGSWNFNSL